MNGQLHAPVALSASKMLPEPTEYEPERPQNRSGFWGKSIFNYVKAITINSMYASKRHIFKINIPAISTRRAVLQRLCKPTGEPASSTSPRSDICATHTAHTRSFNAMGEQRTSI